MQLRTNAQINRFVNQNTGPMVAQAAEARHSEIIAGLQSQFDATRREIQVNAEQRANTLKPEREAEMKYLSADQENVTDPRAEGDGCADDEQTTTACPSCSDYCASCSTSASNFSGCTPNTCGCISIRIFYCFFARWTKVGRWIRSRRGCGRCRTGNGGPGDYENYLFSFASCSLKMSTCRARSPSKMIVSSAPALRQDE